jgi:protein ImuB
MACVDLPALPLQLLLRRHSDWEPHPVAVVDQDKPQGIIQWVNERARAFRILPGMRYAAGLSMARELRAGVVPDLEIRHDVARLTRRLGTFSPEVEPSPTDPGVFWLGATGLTPLFYSLDEWVSRVHADLTGIGFRSTVVVGFSRFGSYAAAKSGRTLVFGSTRQEKRHARSVSIDRLGFDPELRDTLRKLGITTLGGFIDLPASGVLKRFGREAYRHHRLASGKEWAPLEPQAPEEPIERFVLLDSPETNLDRLMALIADFFPSMLESLSRRDQTLTQLFMVLALDDGGERREQLRPARPTLDGRQLLELVRRRLDSMTFPSGVVDIKVSVVGQQARREQLDLFQEQPKRDLEAVNRAFARLRAEFGDGVVVQARLQEGHLPEARFGWEPMEEISSPLPRRISVRPLVRRLFTPSRALPPRPGHEPDGWLVAGMADGPVEEVVGPHVVSGGWWLQAVHRAYHYVRTRNGRWLWIYDDRQRRRWFLQGEVE